MTGTGVLQHLTLIPLFCLLAALILIPGKILSELMAAGCPEARLRHRPGIAWLIIPPAGFLVMSLIMELLLLLGHLSLRNVILMTVAFSLPGTLILIRIRRARGREPDPESSCSLRQLKVPLLILLVYLGLTVYPFDFIYDTTDCGVYVSSGVQAFRNGSWRFIDPEIADGDDAFRQAFFQLTPPDRYESARKFHFEGLMGIAYFIKSLDTGLIEPRYFNLYPLWIGLFVSVLGLQPGVWLVTPFLALCGMIGIFLLAGALAGRGSANLTLGLLAVCVLQVWFGRYISTEMPVQAAIMNALAWMLLFGPAPDRSSGDDRGNCVEACNRRITRNYRGYSRLAMMVSGLMLGTGHFARIDTVLVIPAVAVAGLMWLAFERNLRPYLLFLATYATVTPVAVLTAWRLNETYVLETFVHVDFSMSPSLAGGSAAGVVAIAVFSGWFVRKRMDRITEWYRAHSAVILNIICIAMGIAVFYGYFIRPVLNPPDYELFRKMSKEARSHAFPSMTLRWLGWYMTPPVLFASFAGLCLLMRRRLTLRNILFFLIAAFYCVYFLESLHCTPYHYWGMRRFITVVVPVLFIGSGYFFCRAFQWSRKLRSHLASACVAILLTVTAGALAKDLRLITGFNHWRGSIDSLERINSTLPEDCRLIVPTYPGIYMYTPLKLLFDRKVYMMQNQADTGAVLKIVSKWLENGERVFVMGRTQASGSQVEGLRLIPVLSENLRPSRMEDFVDRKPDRRGAHAFSYHIWEVVTEPATEPMEEIAPAGGNPDAREVYVQG